MLEYYALSSLILGAFARSGWATRRLSAGAQAGMAAGALAAGLGVLAVFVISTVASLSSRRGGDASDGRTSSVWMMVCVVLTALPVKDLQLLGFPGRRGVPVGLLQLLLSLCLVLQALMVVFAAWRNRSTVGAVANE